MHRALFMGEAELPKIPTIFPFSLHCHRIFIFYPFCRPMPGRSPVSILTATDSAVPSNIPMCLEIVIVTVTNAGGHSFVDLSISYFAGSHALRVWVTSRSSY